MATATTLDFTKDTVVFMDDEYYTTTGALKVMGIGRTTLSKEIRENNIETKRHPKGYLFKREAIKAWLDRRFKRMKLKANK